MSKSGFIRSKPNLSAPQIIRAFSKQYGKKITASLIYNVRNAERKKAAAGQAPTTEADETSTQADETSTETSGIAAPTKGNLDSVTPAVSRPKLRTNPSEDSRVETQFRGAVLRIGLDRATVLLEQFRASLESYVDGSASRSPSSRPSSSASGSQRAKESRQTANAN